MKKAAENICEIQCVNIRGNGVLVWRKGVELYSREYVDEDTKKCYAEGNLNNISAISIPYRGFPEWSRALKYGLLCGK